MSRKIVSIETAFYVELCRYAAMLVPPLNSMKRRNRKKECSHAINNKQNLNTPLCRTKKISPARQVDRFRLLCNTTYQMRKVCAAINRKKRKYNISWRNNCAMFPKLIHSQQTKKNRSPGKSFL